MKTKLLGLLFLSIGGPSFAASPVIGVAENVSASNETIRISTPNGRVGISTGTPQNTLDVNGGVLAASMTLTASGTNQYTLMVASGIYMTNGLLRTSGIMFNDGISTTSKPNISSGGSGSGQTQSISSASWITDSTFSNTDFNTGRIAPSTQTINVAANTAIFCSASGGALTTAGGAGSETALIIKIDDGFIAPDTSTRGTYARIVRNHTPTGLERFPMNFTVTSGLLSAGLHTVAIFGAVSGGAGGTLNCSGGGNQYDDRLCTLMCVGVK